MFQTVYISIGLPFAPSAAADATDEWHRQLVRRAPGSRFLRAGRRIWLHRQLKSGGVDQTQLRMASGIVWYWARPIGIEFELSIRSAVATTLAIRPVRLSPAVKKPGYADSVYRALNDVAGQLTGARSPLLVRSDDLHLIVLWNVPNVKLPSRPNGLFESPISSSNVASCSYMTSRHARNRFVLEFDCGQ